MLKTFKCKQDCWITDIDISVKVVCGYKHSLALTNEGQLYVLKHNDVTTRYFNLVIHLLFSLSQ